ncbi:MAG: hypothetical protein HN580_20515 [Deltaproteobacteria bacterium]|jgi:hypothetical protein|nr:hypothetical protein [Deltaproteobacteria bacterium]MBT4268590.1 hypothetical protein [Deltaproteobacteria bacterium]MBT4643787.1 hypothetical protein [Deltaproteobacteria bacterium]MBT6504079.1 hypothetical protein [Deltaproteobacteria bacterium]MBT6613566.1 hypothetical protein [Deltaproteobacteria bacterium]
MEISSLIQKLPEHIELFLDIWARRTREAGYYKYTTAKREDCIRSFWGVLTPILDYLKSNKNLPPFDKFITG